MWDVAGHERFGTMTRVYYKYAIAAFIVFDVSRPATFEAVAKWRQDVNDKVVLANNQPIPLILLANKCDIPGVTIDNEALDEYTKANGFLAWYKTSAQDNINIDSAMQFLVSKILEISKENRPVQVPTPNTVVLTPNNNPPAQKTMDERLKECCN
uniref:Ras-related protein Rab n=1 Tax=Arcella intermedia TaxID=1963864 RepID=A0A6B2LHZ8_9EUKA